MIGGLRPGELSKRAESREKVRSVLQRLGGLGRGRQKKGEHQGAETAGGGRRVN